MFLHSIRWRLQLWHGIILLAVLAGFGFTAHHLQRGNELGRVDQELQRRLGALLDTLRRPRPGERGLPAQPPPRPELDRGGRQSPPPARAVEEFRPFPGEFPASLNRSVWSMGESNGVYYVVWRRDGRELDRSSNAPPDVLRPTRPDGSRWLPTKRTRGTVRELYEVTPPGDCLLVGRSIEPELAELRQLAFWLSALGASVLVLGLAGGWWLATRAIRPIADISAAAVKIATGDLSCRINEADTDSELGRLASVLNSTFSRLDAAFTQQIQFTSDASHELRTPVTVILSQTQMALARERPAADYRATLEACQRAAQRMRRLIESLLELARLDSGQAVIQQHLFDLSRTALECIDLVRPMAEQRSITLKHELPATECLGDSEQISQAITNLLTNAIVHNTPGGEVRVSIHKQRTLVLLSVTNTGPGISPEDLPHLFQRFYRADKSRTGATGGTGLGLAISKALVEAHGGSIEVTSEPGVLTTFTIFLPSGPGT